MGPDIAPGSGVPLTGAPGSQGGFAMGLAVPGLTVPWGHAGYLWIATATSIAIHEVNSFSHWISPSELACHHLASARPVYATLCSMSTSREMLHGQSCTCAPQHRPHCAQTFLYEPSASLG